MNKMNLSVLNTPQGSDIDSRRFQRDILLGSLIAMILWLAVIAMIMAC